MACFHISQTKEIQDLVNQGYIAVKSSGGNQIRLYNSPESLALELVSRFKTCCAIIGNVLYTPTPGAFIGKGGEFVKWSAAKGGWNKVVGVDWQPESNSVKANYTLRFGGKYKRIWLNPNCPSYNGDWL